MPALACSDLMHRRAARRNARAIEAGLVELHVASVDAMPAFDSPFAKVFAVNVYLFHLQPNRSFTLISGAPGLHVIAHHSVEPAASRSRVTLALRFDGLLSGLMGRMTRDINNRYLAMEASGLKARCEKR